MDLDSLYRNSGDILFGRYGASRSLDITVGDHHTTLDFHIQFYNHECVRQFLDELNLVQESVDERNLRQSNPVIQRAYDEYKLLLKLSK